MKKIVGLSENKSTYKSDKIIKPLIGRIELQFSECGMACRIITRLNRKDKNGLTT